MKRPPSKRIKLDKNGMYYPQYKRWFFWHTYRCPGNGKRERFYFERDVLLFLNAKHYQDVETVKRHAAQGIIKWKPE